MECRFMSIAQKLGVLGGTGLLIFSEGKRSCEEDALRSDAAEDSEEDGPTT